MELSATMSYAGPIPPPQILKGIEEILPGATDRILKMAEKQSTHRISIESKVIEGDNYRARIGLWLGFAVAMTLILGGLWVIDRGHDWAGTGVIGSSLLGVVGTFIYGQSSRRQERERRHSNRVEPPTPVPKAEPASAQPLPEE